MTLDTWQKEHFLFNVQCEHIFLKEVKYVTETQYSKKCYKRKTKVFFYYYSRHTHFSSRKIIPLTKY